MTPAISHAVQFDGNIWGASSDVSVGPQGPNAWGALWMLNEMFVRIRVELNDIGPLKAALCNFSTSP